MASQGGRAQSDWHTAYAACAYFLQIAFALGHVTDVIISVIIKSSQLGTDFYQYFQLVMMVVTTVTSILGIGHINDFHGCASKKGPQQQPPVDYERAYRELLPEDKSQ